MKFKKTFNKFLNKRFLLTGLPLTIGAIIPPTSIGLMTYAINETNIVSQMLEETTYNREVSNSSQKLDQDIAFSKANPFDMLWKNEVEDISKFSNVINAFQYSPNQIQPITTAHGFGEYDTNNADIQQLQNGISVQTTTATTTPTKDIDNFNNSFYQSKNLAGTVSNIQFWDTSLKDGLLGVQNQNTTIPFSGLPSAVNQIPNAIKSLMRGTNKDVSDNIKTTFENENTPNSDVKKEVNDKVLTRTYDIAINSFLNNIEQSYQQLNNFKPISLSSTDDDNADGYIPNNVSQTLIWLNKFKDTYDYIYTSINTYSDIFNTASKSFGVNNLSTLILPFLYLRNNSNNELYNILNAMFVVNTDDAHLKSTPFNNSNKDGSTDKKLSITSNPLFWYAIANQTQALNLYYNLLNLPIYAVAVDGSTDEYVEYQKNGYWKILVDNVKPETGKVSATIHFVKDESLNNARNYYYLGNDVGDKSNMTFNPLSFLPLINIGNQKGNEYQATITFGVKDDGTVENASWTKGEGENAEAVTITSGFSNQMLAALLFTAPDYEKQGMNATSSKNKNYTANLNSVMSLNTVLEATKIQTTTQTYQSKEVAEQEDNTKVESAEQPTGNVNDIKATNFVNQSKNITQQIVYKLLKDNTKANYLTILDSSNVYSKKQLENQMKLIRNLILSGAVTSQYEVGNIIARVSSQKNFPDGVGESGTKAFNPFTSENISADNSTISVFTGDTSTNTFKLKVAPWFQIAQKYKLPVDSFYYLMMLAPNQVVSLDLNAIESISWLSTIQDGNNNSWGNNTNTINTSRLNAKFGDILNSAAKNGINNDIFNFLLTSANGMGFAVPQDGTSSVTKEGETTDTKQSNSLSYIRYNNSNFATSIFSGVQMFEDGLFLSPAWLNKEALTTDVTNNRIGFEKLTTANTHNNKLFKQDNGNVDSTEMYFHQGTTNWSYVQYNTFLDYTYNTIDFKDKKSNVFLTYTENNGTKTLNDGNGSYFLIYYYLTTFLENKKTNINFDVNQGIEQSTESAASFQFITRKQKSTDKTILKAIEDVTNNDANNLSETKFAGGYSKEKTSTWKNLKINVLADIEYSNPIGENKDVSPTEALLKAPFSSTNGGGLPYWIEKRIEYGQTTMYDDVNYAIYSYLKSPSKGSENNQLFAWFNESLEIKDNKVLTTPQWVYNYNGSIASIYYFVEKELEKQNKWTDQKRREVQDEINILPYSSKNSYANKILNNKLDTVTVDEGGVNYQLFYNLNNKKYFPSTLGRWTLANLGLTTNDISVDTVESKQIDIEALMGKNSRITYSDLVGVLQAKVSWNNLKLNQDTIVPSTSFLLTGLSKKFYFNTNNSIVDITKLARGDDKTLFGRIKNTQVTPDNIIQSNFLLANTTDATSLANNYSMFSNLNRNFIKSLKSNVNGFANYNTPSSEVFNDGKVGFAIFTQAYGKSNVRVRVVVKNEDYIKIPAIESSTNSDSNYFDGSGNISKDNQAYNPEEQSYSEYFFTITNVGYYITRPNDAAGSEDGEINDEDVIEITSWDDLAKQNLTYVNKQITDSNTISKYKQIINTWNNNKNVEENWDNLIDMINNLIDIRSNDNKALLSIDKAVWKEMLETITINTNNKTLEGQSTFNISIVFKQNKQLKLQQKSTKNEAIKEYGKIYYQKVSQMDYNDGFDNSNVIQGSGDIFSWSVSDIILVTITSIIACITFVAVWKYVAQKHTIRRIAKK